MFGFGKRKKYNGSVDTKLNNEYQIDTQNAPGFPGIFAYLELIDKAWASKMNEDEAAFYIATLYYCGLMKHENYKEASHLLSRIDNITNFGKSKGMISQEKHEKFYNAINEANKIHYKNKPKSPIEIASENLFNDFNLQLDEMPEHENIINMFEEMSEGLSQDSKTALLYRLVAFHFLMFSNIMKENGNNVKVDDIFWLTQLCDKSVDWSEKSSDHVKLETITSSLNYKITELFDSLGIHRR